MAIRLEAPPGKQPIQLAALLDNPELSDVRVTVPGESELQSLFFGHKLLLASASDTFKALFYGGVKNEDPVEIKGTTPAAFKALLEYIYCGTVSLQERELFDVLDVAHRYRVRGLEALIMEHLASTIDASNVARLVLYGQNYIGDALPKFWEAVQSYAQALLESNEFLLLQKATIMDLLQCNLQAEETLIFSRVSAWGEAECTRLQLPPEPANIRTVLGDVLRLVRFPLMTGQEFACGPGKSDLLSQEEKLDLYPWFVGKEKPAMFSTTPRLEYVCRRFRRSDFEWTCDDEKEPDAIDFQVSRDITVIGVGAYVAHSDTAVATKVSIELRSEVAVVAKTEASLLADGTKRVMTVRLPGQPRALAGKWYTLFSTIVGPPTYFGVGGVGTRTVTTNKGDVTFSFKSSNLSKFTDENRGQLPRIIFAI
ncbi:BTB/POZ domain-containing protein 3-like isoform 1 [Aphelenchoides avenae]|nr:BTB/POZ domain-containing protein 3-like isoform 1 [Aphelenchus avenae]